MHKHLQVTSGIAGDAVEVIAYALCQTPLGKGFAMGNNLIYATVPAVTNLWRTALGESAKQPTKQRVTAALQQLANMEYHETLQIAARVAEIKDGVVALST